jgi:hypothetical protein
MADIMKYDLKQINDIACSGFKYEIPEEAYNMINYLSTQVGTAGLSSTKFVKTARDDNETAIKDMNNSFAISKNKKRRGNKGMEVNSEDWETIRSFQATKIEQKTGLDGDIDNIRLLLNKLTDKTYLDIREKMIEKLDKIGLEFNSDEDYKKVGNIIYELSATNKFYSKIFAELFAELCGKYIWLMNIFNEKYSNIMCQYINIQYIDSEKDYDGFCEMNKQNDKRRSITMFMKSLANIQFIMHKDVVMILKKLLELVCNMINTPEKKNEVDELTENIAILFDKTSIGYVDNIDELYINGKTIIETINSLAKSKAKDYQSLSNKAIFRFMDLVEI